MRKKVLGCGVFDENDINKTIDFTEAKEMVCVDVKQPTVNCKIVQIKMTFQRIEELYAKYYCLKINCKT